MADRGLKKLFEIVRKLKEDKLGDKDFWEGFGGWFIDTMSDKVYNVTNFGGGQTENHQAFCDAHPELFPNGAHNIDFKRWIKITTYGEQIGMSIPSQRIQYLYQVQNLLMKQYGSRRAIVTVTFVEPHVTFDEIPLQDFLTANNWIQVKKSGQNYG